MARGMGSLTGDKFASARDGSVWVVPPPQLEPPAPENKTVYISYRNISDAQFDLTDLLKNAATADGWQVVTDPTLAAYRLRGSTRFFGEVEPESGGSGTGRMMGAITGAAVGVGTGILIADATDSTGWGIAGGAVAGGLVGAGMSNRSMPREWAMISDFVLEGRLSEPVEFELSTSAGSSATSAAGTGNARTTDGGGTTTSNSSSASAKKVSEYYPHGIRLSVWANQMNMQEDEALPLIIERCSSVVTQMLPQ